MFFKEVTMKKSLGINLAELKGGEEESEQALAKIYIEKPPDEETLRLKGKLYALISLASADSLKLKDFLDKALEELKIEYYGDTQDNVLKSLERGIKKAYFYVQAEIQAKGILTEGVDFNIVVAILWGNVLYLGQLGLTKVAILREGNLKFIGETEGFSKDIKSETSRVRLSSGLIHEKDFLILGTTQFWEAFPPESIKTYLLGYPLGQAVKLLTEKLGKDQSQALVKNRALVAGLFLNFEFKIFPTQEESLSIITPERLLQSPSRANVLTKLKSLFSLKKVAGLVPVKAGKGLLSSASLPLKANLGKGAAVLRDKARWLKQRLMRFLVIVLPSLKERMQEEEPEVYLKKPATGNPRSFLLLAFLLIVILAVSLFITLKNKGRAQDHQKFQTLVTKVQENLKESQRVSLSETEKKNKLEEAQSLLSGTSSLNLNQEDGEQLKELKTEIEKGLYKVFSVQEEVVFDLSSIDKNAAPTGLSENEGKLYLLDRIKANLYQVDLVSKKTESFSFNQEEVGKPTLLAVNPQGVFLLSLDRGVSKFSPQTNGFALVIEKDDAWGEVADFDSFYSNLYLLSPSQEQIFKYVPLEAGFSNHLQFLNEPGGADLQKGVALTIDGSVYVLAADGQVFKYAAGKRQDFSLKGFDLGFKKPSRIFTQTDFKEIYILDSEHKGVAIFDKDGNYVKLVQNDGWNNLLDLWVDAKEENLYLLSQTKISKVGLK